MLTLLPPRKLSAVIVTAVYITTQEKKNKKLALNKLYGAINKQENLHREAAFLVALLDDCNMFRDSANNINELTTSAGFLMKCIGDVVPTVKVHCFSNQKPWINAEVGAKIKDRATAHSAIAGNP